MNILKLDTNFNKPKFLFTTDMHHHIYNDFSKPDSEYTNDRFRFQIEKLKEMLEDAKENDYVFVMGGDLFHKRAYVDTRVFNQVFHTFSEFPTVPKILLRGNHDSITNSLYTLSSLDTFEEIPNTVVVSEPTILVTETWSMTALPYGEELEEMKLFLQEAKQYSETELANKEHYLVAHIGVDGSVTGKYSHPLSGAFNLGDLSPEFYSAVMLGHYHKRQTLGGYSHVFYGGNPIQTSFSDEGQEKGYHIVSATEISFVPITQKMFLTITAESNVSDEVLKNNYIQFKGTPEEVKSVLAVQEETDEPLVNIRVTVQKDYHVESRLNISANATAEQVVRAYTEKQCPDVTESALKCLELANVSD